MRSMVALPVLLLGVSASVPSAAAGPTSTPARGAEKGDWEVMLSAVGDSTQDLKSHTYGFTGSVGNYVGEHWILGLRQSVNFSSFSRNGNGNDLFGSTRVFFDRLVTFESADWFRPSAGITLGGTYGRGIPDSFGIGPDITLRFYADRRTFGFLGTEYQFLTSETDRWEDFVDNGNLTISLGIGLNF